MVYGLPDKAGSRVTSFHAATGLACLHMHRQGKKSKTKLLAQPLDLHILLLYLLTAREGD